MANPRMSAEIGRVLGGRYRLVAPIGIGASAQVFLAEDVRLRRRVAVKMLHEALADDAEFLRRFRAEARAAAALSHPNVMAVYDWGDDGTAFIVTEYLGGGSLRAMLDKGTLLNPSQALGVGLEAARALDYAHRRGFVHRDIKPANLLFGEDQRLRIADFGLARALAEAAWTEPQGAMLGTARYASPEQAKGEKLSGKADVYALALVLIEAVTGVVPFTADTTLGTLMARVDRPLEVPEALGPLQRVLHHAGNPDPEKRIDARKLAAGLLRVAKELPRPEALSLAGAIAHGGVLAEDSDPTVHGPVVPVDDKGDLTEDDLDLDPPDWVNRVEPSALEPEPGRERIVVDLTDGAAASPSEPAAPEATEPRGHDEGAEGGGDEEPGEAEGDHRRRKWPWVAAVVLLLAGIGGTAAALAANRDSTPAPTRPALVLPVPDLVGLQQEKAVQVVENAGWVAKVSSVRRNDTVKGEVLEVSPRPGVRLARSRTVDLVVSAGQEIIDLPSGIAGATLAKAEAELTRVGLTYEVVARTFDEDVAKGSVIGYADGTPEKVERGSKVGLVISDGPSPRTVPSVRNRTESEATSLIKGQQLVVAITRTFSDDVPEGTVISQMPRADTEVPRGSTVTIEVSRGPQLVKVPSVAKASTPAEAAQILRAAGLVPGSVSGSPDGRPTTSPPAGTEVRKGTKVDIILR